MLIERLDKTEGDAVKPYHLDVYSDFIQLIKSRRVFLNNLRKLQYSFDNHVGRLFYDRVEGKRLTPQIELVKSVEIFCGLTTDRNWPHVLALIIEGFKDPSQIRSTRKIMKVMFKLAQSPENMIS
jgi:hypothetical protein